MAAGLGFKDFTTGEVLTAADVDGYLMQGVWVFASAAARDAAVTSPQEGNFAYLKDTNVTTYYTGSAWANLDTTGMTNPMTTTGDVIYSSSGSTPARLGIGTAGQVLKVNSGATAPEWGAASSASGLTLISTTTIGSGVSSVNVTGAFSATYDNYLITLTDGVSSTNVDIKLTLGATTTGYYNFLIYGNPSSGTVNGSGQSNVSSWRDVGTATTLILDAQIRLFAPFLTKRTIFGSTGAGAVSNGTQVWNSGFVDNATSYTDFTLAPNSGTFTGGKIRVYGYQNS